MLCPPESLKRRLCGRTRSFKLEPFIFPATIYYRYYTFTIAININRLLIGGGELTRVGNSLPRSWNHLISLKRGMVDITLSDTNNKRLPVM